MKTTTTGSSAPDCYLDGETSFLRGIWKSRLDSHSSQTSLQNAALVGFGLTSFRCETAPSVEQKSQPLTSIINYVWNAISYEIHQISLWILNISVFHVPKCPYRSLKSRYFLHSLRQIPAESHEAALSDSRNLTTKIPRWFFQKFINFPSFLFPEAMMGRGWEIPLPGRSEVSAIHPNSKYFTQPTSGYSEPIFP